MNYKVERIWKELSRLIMILEESEGGKNHKELQLAWVMSWL